MKNTIKKIINLETVRTIGTFMWAVLPFSLVLDKLNTYEFIVLVIAVGINIASLIDLVKSESSFSIKKEFFVKDETFEEIKEFIKKQKEVEKKEKLSVEWDV